MRLARIALVLYGLGLLALGAFAYGDIAEHGKLTYFPSWIMFAFASFGLVLLVVGLFDARRRAELSETRATELNFLTGKLEATLATMRSMNGRLYESEVRYKGLVDAQGDAIFRRSPDSRLTYANDAFFKLFGLSPQNDVGLPFAPELHPDSRAPFFGSFAGLETGKARVPYDQHVRTAYGWRWIAWEDYAIRDTAGQLIEVQSVGRDITERKALEDALTEARDKAEAANRAKSGFLATMSHEIRTPMNGVLGMARLLLENEPAPEQKTYIEAIQHSGEALLTLIEEILDFSKIESGTITLEDDEVDVRPLLCSVVELLGMRAHAKGIEIVSFVEPEVPEAIRCDGVRLRQILTNLVGNAIKFTERGGVCVNVEQIEGRTRRWLRFEVRDTGVGVPPEKRDEIFKEFMQADSSHARKFGGTGLGLAISKKLVTAMGGEIGVDAAPGGGSVFWWELPVIALREPDSLERYQLAGTKVAFVTRNAVLREGLVSQLRAGGAEAVSLGLDPAAAGGHDADIILIDAGTENTPELPVHPDGRARAFVLLPPGARGKLNDLKDLGFSGYLIKPIRQSSLFQRLRTRDGIMTTPELPAHGALPIPAISATQAVAEPPPLVQPRIEAHPVSPPRAAIPHIAKQAKKILLIEDNPINAMLSRELLRRRGFEVNDVASGEAALAIVCEKEFDVILTDLHMPGLDGLETTQRMRQWEKAEGRQRTPIVALTADADHGIRSACQEAGMDGFLTKPINPAELDTVLNTIFRTGRIARGMTDTGSSVRGNRTRAAIQSYLQPRTATMLVLGSACGLPLLTIANVLGLWLTDNKVSMTDIGLFAYTLLPYSFKFVWAPLLDQVRLPVLHRLLGKRRSWMLVAQFGILIAFIGLWFSDPQTQLLHVALFALLLGFSGASQDISVDAWRIEIAPPEEQGTMLGAYQLGYRLTALATAALAPYIAQLVSWRAGLAFLGCLIFLGMAATLLAKRPPERDASEDVKAAEKALNSRSSIGTSLAWFYGAVIAPFTDFFRQHGWTGLLILAMIGTYRLPDFIMGTVARPMYRQSFSLIEIGTMSGLIGVWVTIAGALIGGFFVFRFGIKRSLLIGLFAVILGNLAYALLAASGHSIPVFALAICLENLAAGFAGTALLAYMSSLTSVAFTATQYALFSSFYALPGKLLGGMSGIFVDWLSKHRHLFDHAIPGLAALSDKVVGFVPFFIATALTGLLALLLLMLVYRREPQPTARPVPG